MKPQSTKEMMSNLSNSFELVVNHMHTMSKDDLSTSIRMLYTLYNTIYEDFMFAEAIDNMSQEYSNEIDEAEEVARTESALWFEAGEKCHEVD